jgi:hypothetical protein
VVAGIRLGPWVPRHPLRTAMVLAPGHPPPVAMAALMHGAAVARPQLTAPQLPLLAQVMDGDTMRATVARQTPMVLLPLVLVSARQRPLHSTPQHPEDTPRPRRQRPSAPRRPVVVGLVGGEEPTLHPHQLLVPPRPAPPVATMVLPRLRHMVHRKRRLLDRDMMTRMNREYP